MNEKTSNRSGITESKFYATYLIRKMIIYNILQYSTVHYYVCILFHDKRNQIHKATNAKSTEQYQKVRMKMMSLSRGWPYENGDDCDCDCDRRCDHVHVLLRAHGPRRVPKHVLEACLTYFET